MSLSGWKWPGWARRGSSPPREIAVIDDPWPTGPLDIERAETPIGLLLSEIEAAACEVYARHDLPSLPGHYARSPKANAWRFLSETLTAEERWGLVLAQKDGSKWRFGSLEDLGDHPDNPPEVRRAAEALRACHQLRARLREGGGSDQGETLETAIRLGVIWRQMDVAGLPAPRNEPLRLTLPAKTRAKAAPRKKARPRS
jgi:hypothetical protein